MQRTRPLAILACRVVSFAAWLICAATAGAQTAEVRPGEAGSPTVEQLIQQLDADEFAVRQQAARQLEGAGPEAVPALEEAARNGSDEAAARALDILRRYHADRAGAVRDAATAALERLAKLESHPIALKAEAILRPLPSPATPNFAPVPVGVAPARVQIQIGGAIGGPGGVARRIAIRTVNGVKETELTEGDRKLRLVQDPAKGLEIEITEKQAGKEVTRKYAAKDLDELRKNHPEGAKAYDEIAQKTGGGGGGIQVAGGQIVPRMIPFAPRAPAPQPNGAPGQNLPAARTPVDQIDRIIQSYDAQIERLKNSPGAEPTIESLRRSKARLEELKQRMQPAVPEK